MQIKLCEIVVGDRVRQELGDIDALASSITEVGLLQPIVITEDKKLVAGQRRVKAAEKLGWEEISAHVASNLDTALKLLTAEKEENTCRKDFSITEAVAAADKLEPMLAKLNAQKQKEGTKEGGRGKRKDKLGSKLEPSLSGTAKTKKESKTRQQAAKAVGMKATTLDKAKEVVKAAKKNPKKFGKLVEQMNATGKVDGAYKQLVKEEKAEIIRAEPPPLPDGPFRVIVIDPPWSYDNRATDTTHRAANPYESMTIEQIKAMPIARMSHEDCILWLWTTNAHIREAFSIADAWGFACKTILTWAKDRMGTGDWLRGQTEHCLLCVRGKPIVTLTNQTTLIRGPLREHSRKPDEFYALVEQLCPGSKLELFARQQRTGWSSHGNETDKFQGDEGVPSRSDG